MSRPAKIVVGVAVVLGTIVLALALYVLSGRFHHDVLARIVAQLEQVTGGHVELRDFRVRLWPVQAELLDVAIHGRERPDEPPLLSAGRVVVGVKIISLLRRTVDWQLLRFERPRAYLRVDAHGNSNIPQPKVKRAPGKGPLDEVFDLAIKRLEVANGRLTYNDQQIPLEFTADDVQAALAYDAAHDLYDGQVVFASQLPTYATYKSAAAAGGQRPGVPSRAQVQLQLSRNAVEIRQLTWKTPRSEVQAAGRLSGFTQLKIALNYQARLDGKELAIFGDLPELRQGEAQLAGTATYDVATQAFDTSGDLRVARLALRLPELELAGVYGSAKFHATKETIEVLSFRAFLFGGELTGRARAENLGAAATLRVATDVHGLSVSQLTRIVSTRRMPLAELHWTGSVNGHAEIEYRFAREKGHAGNLMVKSSLTLQPPNVIPPGFIPVSGQADVVYAPARDQLEVHNLSLQTPGSHISADGALGAGRRAGQTNLQVTVSVSGLAEWSPVIGAVRPGKEPLPLEIGGRVEFRGTVRGTVSSPNLEGHLQAVNFRYAGTQWDRFSGDLAYSPQVLRVTQAQLQRAGSSARFDLTANLQRGEFTDATPFSLQAVVERAQVADVQALAGTAYPITGQLNASIRASGTKLNPQGSGFVQVTNGTLEGQSFDSLRADLNFSQRVLNATNIVLKKGPSQIGGEAEYRPADHFYRFQLAGNRIALAEIAALAPIDLTISGLADFRASGAGTVERPSLNASAQISNLAVSGERVGTLSATIETRDNLLTATLQSQLLKGNASAKVTAEMAGDFPARGRLEFYDVDLDPLLGTAVRGRITTHSSTTGAVTLSGPLKKADQLSADAELSAFHIAIAQVDLRNERPLRASYRNGVVQLEQAHLAGTDTDVQVAGSVKVLGPPSARTLNLRADGRVNLALLRTINPTLETSGQVMVHLSTAGTFQRPLVTGRADFLKASLALEGFPVGLSDIEGTVAFDTTRLRIQTLTAQVGGGNVNLSGFVDYVSTPVVFRLHGTADKVRLRYPEGTSAHARCHPRPDRHHRAQPAFRRCYGDAVALRAAV